MRIGIIGAGRIAGNAGRLFARAGHEVLLSYARDPATLAARAADIGAKGRVAGRGGGVRRGGDAVGAVGPDRRGSRRAAAAELADRLKEPAG